MANRTDILRIIAAKKKRLEDLSKPSVWESITRHMEGGELREFKQSCIDDEIIIEMLEKSLKDGDE